MDSKCYEPTTKPAVPPKPVISAEVIKLLNFKPSSLKFEKVKFGSKSVSLTQNSKDRKTNSKYLSDSNQKETIPIFRLSEEDESEDVFSNNKLSTKVPPPIPSKKTKLRSTTKVSKQSFLTLSRNFESNLSKDSKKASVKSLTLDRPQPLVNQNLKKTDSKLSSSIDQNLIQPQTPKGNSLNITVRPYKECNNHSLTPLTDSLDCFIPLHSQSDGSVLYPFETSNPSANRKEDIISANRGEGMSVRVDINSDSNNNIRESSNNVTKDVNENYINDNKTYVTGDVLLLLHDREKSIKQKINSSQNLINSSSVPVEKKTKKRDKPKFLMSLFNKSMRTTTNTWTKQLAATTQATTASTTQATTTSTTQATTTSTTQATTTSITQATTATAVVASTSTTQATTATAVVATTSTTQATTATTSTTQATTATTSTTSATSSKSAIATSKDEITNDETGGSGVMQGRNDNVSIKNKNTAGTVDKEVKVRIFGVNEEVGVKVEDNLDVLIPIVPESKHSSKKSGGKKGLQSRAVSESQLAPEEVKRLQRGHAISMVNPSHILTSSLSRSGSSKDLSTFLIPSMQDVSSIEEQNAQDQSTLSTQDSSTTEDISNTTHPLTSVMRGVNSLTSRFFEGKGKSPDAKLSSSMSVFYLPMDRQNSPEDMRRLVVSSCSDLGGPAQSRRVGELKDESKLENYKDNNKQGCTMPYRTTTIGNAALLSLVSTSSSLSNPDVFSPSHVTISDPASQSDRIDATSRSSDDELEVLTGAVADDSGCSGDSRFGYGDDEGDESSEDNYGLISDLEYVTRDKFDEVAMRNIIAASSFDGSDLPSEGDKSFEAPASPASPSAAAADVEDVPFDSNDDSETNLTLLDGNETNNEMKLLNISTGDTSNSSHDIDISTDTAGRLDKSSSDNHLDSSFCSFVSSSSSAGSSTVSLHAPSNCGSSFLSPSVTDISSCSGDGGTGDIGVDDKSNTGVSFTDDGASLPNAKEGEIVVNKRKDPFLVANEIFRTEENFIKVLKLINEDFPNFIQSERMQGRAGDGPSDVRQLIRYLPNLQEVNKELCKQLKQRIENWDSDPRIADIFVKTGHFLKLYTSYIKNFSRMVSDLETTRRKNPEFDKAVAEFECTPSCNRLGLKHYMLKPIQRIPQYKLLLQEYLKCLSPHSPDYNNAKEAIPIVGGVSEHANESVRNWENQNKMIQIQSTLLGHPIIKPDRKFVKEGRLMKLSRKEMQTRMFFLFNDCLLYTTPVGGNCYRVKQTISLNGLTVGCPCKEYFENEFSIISVERSFTVAASSKEERQQWVLAIEKAVLENKEIKASLEKAINERQFSHLYDPKSDPKTPTKTQGKDKHGIGGGRSVSVVEVSFKTGDRAPVWIQDDRASMCMCCAKEFSVTFRRHHCRGCGKIICSNCSQCRAPLKYSGYKPARVCIECFNYLQSDILEEEENSVSMVTIAVGESDENVTETTSDYHPVSNSTTPSTPSTPFNKRNLSLLFKKKNVNVKENIRSPVIPSIFTEVQASDSESEMSGYLLQFEKKKWKKYWFVLKNKVLYTFKAMQDKAAIRTLPLLSYHVQDGSSGYDNDEKTFELYHDGLPSISLRAETCAHKLKWLSALQKAVIV